MRSSMHLFYCLHCRMNVVGATVDRLCDHVNEHNDRAHPDYNDGVTWTPENIARSDYYAEQTSVGALPQYTEPHGTAKNSHPDRLITADDRALLSEMGIRW